MLKPATSSTLLTSFSPYTGVWDRSLASHLLRRATIGPSEETIQEAINLGLEGTIEQLFADLPMPAPPTYYDYEDDPSVALGESWIDYPLPNPTVAAGAVGARKRSLETWQINLIYEEGMSIRERLTLFWNNHFAINRGTGEDARFPYRYISTIRAAAWGDFRQLTKDITIDPWMLRYLGGNLNVVGSPNENYAREILELFTIGKGPLVGDGDYTNYTEEDVISIARVLTGWRDFGFNSYNPEQEFTSSFVEADHDEGDKQLSHRFDNVVISNMGDQEYEHLVDLIFSKDEVARFICRKLYRWFVYYKIDENIEANIIQPMADILIMNNYEIRPALQALLSSEHFFDKKQRGVMIRNPFDYVFTILKSTVITISEEDAIRRTLWEDIYLSMSNIGMDCLSLPNVAGWRAYYKAPLYYRTWITANTLSERSEFAKKIISGGFHFMGNPLKIDTIAWIATFDNPGDPNDLVSEMTERLCPLPLTVDQKTALKEFLTVGLPDFEWGVEYFNYLSNPDHLPSENAIKNKLQDLLENIFSMAEFHLS